MVVFNKTYKTYKIYLLSKFSVCFCPLQRKYNNLKNFLKFRYQNTAKQETKINLYKIYFTKLEFSKQST